MKLPEILNIKNAIIIFVIAAVAKTGFFGLVVIGIKFLYPSSHIYGFSSLQLFLSLIIDSLTIILAVRLFNVNISDQLKKIKLVTIFLFSVLAILIFNLTLSLVNPIDFFEKLANHKITVLQYDFMIFEKPNFTNIFYFFLMVIITPIIEEILYRGVILNLFLKIYSLKISLIVSSLIFAFVHLEILRFGYLFLIGMLFGFAYYKTKSIYTSIFIHFVINIMSMATSYKYIELNNATFSKYFLYIAILLAAVFIVFNSLNKETNSIKFATKTLTTKREVKHPKTNDKSTDDEEL